MASNDSMVNEGFRDKLTWFSKTYHSYVEHIKALNHAQEMLKKYNVEPQYAFKNNYFISSGDERDDDLRLYRTTIMDVEHCESELQRAEREYDYFIYDNAKKAASLQAAIEKDVAKYVAKAERERSEAELERAAQQQDVKDGRGNRGCLAAAIALVIVPAIFRIIDVVSGGALSHSSGFSDFRFQLITVLVVYIVFVYPAMQNRAIDKKFQVECTEIESAVIASYKSAEQEYKSAEQEMALRKKDAHESLQKLQQSVAEIRSLKESAEEQGVIRTAILLEKWESEYATRVLSELDCIESLYGELASSHIIPDEEDWCLIDEILRMVRSGRAHDLASALNLVDTKLYRRKNINVGMAQIAAIREQTTTIREQTKSIEGLAHDAMEQRERHRAAEEAEHQARMEQREKHRSEQAAENAQQAQLLAQQAQLLKEDISLQAENLRANQERAAEEKQFYSDVRDRWKG